MTDPARQNELQRWADRLRAAAALAWQIWPDQTANPEELARTFRDEAGHRRAVDEPFLRAILGLAPTSAAGQDWQPDAALWHAAASRDRAAAVEALSFQPPPGPLTPAGREPIEIWTESELCLLHAAWRIARLSGDEALRERCLAAAAWHVEYTQADNATNHPWAIHVFVVLGALRAGLPERGEAVFHVEQLLHNAMVSTGRPDRLSAHIFEDAAGELDAEADR